MLDVFAILPVLVVAILTIGVWQLHHDFAGLLTQIRDALVEMRRLRDAARAAAEDANRAADRAIRAAEGATRAAEATRDIAIAIRDHYDRAAEWISQYGTVTIFESVLRRRQVDLLNAVSSRF